MVNEFLFVEKYRPKTISECILPKKLKNTFQQFVDNGNIPNLLLTGGSGVGKTTVARALCEELGCDYIIINGSEESGIDVLRNKIKNFASTVSFSDGGRKIVILDEADYLNPNSFQPALRGFIEEFSKNCGFIFTCNYKNRIIPAIHSRCSVIEFKISGKERKTQAELFYKRVVEILENESIEVPDKNVLVQLVLKYFPDYRRILNELQRYSSSGMVDAGILADLNDTTFEKLLIAMKKKDFDLVRGWVARNSDIDNSKIFRKLYDSAKAFLAKKSIPSLCLIIADYQYKNAFVVDAEINLTACLTEIMIDCEFGGVV